VGAEEAERIGMITKAVEDNTHLDEAMKIATVIANNPRLAVMAGKESVNQQAETPLIPGLKLERRLFHGLFSTPDQKEGMAAFAEKRKPNYKRY
jgi:enoyl-CoA hydratase/carnithine racemase